MNFLGQSYQELDHHRQTDRQTDRCDWKHYHVALAADNYRINNVQFYVFYALSGLVR